MTGDFGQAIKMAAEILATRGHIYPATQSNVTLAACMDDGSIVRGETNITASKQRIVELMLEPPDPPPPPETLAAIAAADLITIGPGSLLHQHRDQFAGARDSGGAGRRRTGRGCLSAT